MPDDTLGIPEPSPRDPRSTLPAESSGEATARIGNYRLLQKLGEGGMGEVYLAEQLKPIQRRVAIKIIKPGMDTREVVSRFQAEGQALALMNHPCIARAYDVGTTEQGRPYFVMEYVAGEPITAYCDRHQLGLRERLALFARVCDGVQHAHQKAIIHRDLKPQNVLVTRIDDQPVPKIIDFGVAKAIGSSLSEATVFTALGQIIGTPEYMSPEQIELASENIDTRTDIYSLGVVLYELITGLPPFDVEDFRRDGFDAIRRRIREAEPPKPSTRVGNASDSALSARNRNSEPARLASELKGDLDWITLKALEKDRARRYASASELAQDIQRFLQHEPVLASPPSVRYRLAKLARRHRGAVIALGTILGVLVATSAVSTVLYLRAERESRRAHEQAARAEQVATFMRDMLAGVGPSVAMGRDTQLLHEILDKTATRVEHDLGGQPRVEADLRSVLAGTYDDLGEYEAALPQAQRALARYQETLGDRDSNTVSAIARLAQVEFRLGHLEAAESLFTAALDLGRRGPGPEHRATLTAETGLADVCYYLNDLSRADSLGREALAGLERRLGERSPEAMATMVALGQIATDQRRYGAAESLFTRVIDLLDEVYGPEYPMRLSAQVGLGWAYRLAGRYSDAERETRAALEAERRVLGNEHAETLTAINNLAIIYNDLHEYRRAEPLYLENVTVGFKVQGPKHPEAIASVVNLASFYQGHGRYAEAESRATQAIQLFRGVVPDDYIGRLIALEIRGVCRVRLGRFAEAEPDLATAFAGLAPKFGPDHRRVKEMRSAMHEMYVRLGKPAQAARYSEV